VYHSTLGSRVIKKKKRSTLDDSGKELFSPWSTGSFSPLGFRERVLY
jgi:hypothetical protein